MRSLYQISRRLHEIFDRYTRNNCYFWTEAVILQELMSTTMSFSLDVPISEKEDTMLEERMKSSLKRDLFQIEEILKKGVDGYESFFENLFPERE